MHILLITWRRNVDPYAAGGEFGQYKMMQKIEKWLQPWDMGTHMNAL